MQASVLTIGLVGIEAHLVRVEVDSGRGPASFLLVGLAEASVREARVRVRSALRGLGVDIDEYVLTVSLSPADVRKLGSAFDLAIAIGVLAALGRLPAPSLQGVALMGELALSGDVRPVRGVLAALLEARRLGIERAIVPQANAAEAAAVTGVAVEVAPSLASVVAALRGESSLPAAKPASSFVEPAGDPFGPDMSEVKGQPVARRALEIAAAGGHNILMVGPPGAGKTMLARRMPSILPPLDVEESLEVTAIHSVAGTLPPGAGLMKKRPFRAPHHTASAAALTGGGFPIRPGEIALAHRGCLFLDELLEFARPALEALRQPLEDGIVTVCRARERAVFPARCLLIAAVNPCPCGYAGSPRCVCSAERVRAYRSRLSGPLLDRIDVQVLLPPAQLQGFLDLGEEESSSAIRARVLAARAIQSERRAINACLSARDLSRAASLDKTGRAKLSRAAESLGLSARAHTKILRVARTIADLEGATAIREPHLAEAIHLRITERRVEREEAPATRSE